MEIGRLVVNFGMSIFDGLNIATVFTPDFRIEVENKLSAIPDEEVLAFVQEVFSTDESGKPDLPNSDLMDELKVMFESYGAQALRSLGVEVLIAKALLYTVKKEK